MQEGHRVYKFSHSSRRQKLIDAGLVVGDYSDVGGKNRGRRHSGHLESSMRWANVNVSQPLDNLHLIPDDMPVVIGTNAHEGQIFVYSAFPAPMPKVVYWMFVGALFREVRMHPIIQAVIFSPGFPNPLFSALPSLFASSVQNAGRVLGHYRDVVRGIEEKANGVGERRLREEEVRMGENLSSSMKGGNVDAARAPYAVLLYVKFAPEDMTHCI